MSTTKHTPGPWQYAFEGGTVAFIVEADGTTIGKISTLENSTAHERLAANASLIAAAPLLLAFAERQLANSAALGMSDDEHNALYDLVKSAGGVAL